MGSHSGNVPPGQTHWDRYWQADRLSACLADSATHNYEPTLRAGWSRFFESLPGGARLLDIGTGNGAIALIAAETAAARGEHFEIHGVDAAAIDPQRFVNAPSSCLAAIRFHAHTRCEALPFSAAYFDAISGQYALEYTKVPDTLAELARVAKPGALVRFVLHAREGVTAAGAARDLGEIAFLENELHLLSRARALMHATFAFERAAAYDATLEASAHKARERYLAAAQQADARYPEASCKGMYKDLLDGIRSAWDRRQTLTLDFVLDGIAAIETEMHAHCARLQDLLHAAVTHDQAAALMEQCEQCGFGCAVVSAITAPDKSRLLGWCLTASRCGNR